MRRQFVFFAPLVALLAACTLQPAAHQHVAYLTGRSGPPWQLLSAARLHSALGAQPVDSWAGVLAVHAAEPLDGLIIDASAAGQIDPAELGALYRQCVVLAFFNLHSPAVAKLVQDPSIREGGWMDGSQPYPGDFYIIVHRQASGSFGDCVGAAPVNSAFVQGGLSKSRSQSSLSTAADFQLFLKSLRLEFTAQP